MGKLTLKSNLSFEKQVELEKLKSIQNQTIVKATSKKDLVGGIDWLIKTYPKLFSKDYDKPLAVGIDKMIFSDQGNNLPQSKSIIRQSIKLYVGHSKYLKTIISSEHRYDLQGQISGPIDPDHKQQTKDRLNVRQQKKK